MIHYRDMGFVVATAEDAMKLYNKIYNETFSYRQLHFRRNKEHYIVHRFNNVEFWYHFGPKKSQGVEFIAANGDSFSVKFKGIVEDSLKRNKKNNWSGSVVVAFEELSMGIPLVVDVVNGNLLLDKHNRLEIDSTCNVEIGVFAETLKFVDRENDSDVKMADESFIPAGLFDGNSVGKVLFNGIVEYVSLKKNPFSSVEYYELGVKCLSMKFCVLLATSLVNERDIVVGDVVNVFGWMSAKICL